MEKLMTLRSGYLPRNQRITWRANSGLNDGKASGVDLVGGYYDAGDNVKFGLPMAFTVTMMSWSIIEYGKQMAVNGELRHAMEAVRWGTDYFIKAHPRPYVLYGEVGDGNSDHYCWQRPEDMITDRRAYKIDPSNPGSDLSGETAAAMAAASIVFRRSDPAYSRELLRHAYQLFELLINTEANMTAAHQCRSKILPFSGYNDELLWAAAWLYQASNNKYYLDYLGRNGFNGWNRLGHERVRLGRQIRWGSDLVPRYYFQQFTHCCTIIGYIVNMSHQVTVYAPPAVLMQEDSGWFDFPTDMEQHAVRDSASFLATVYSDYLTSSRRSLKCAAGNVAPFQLLLSQNLRWITFSETIQELRAIWLVMETITLAKFITEWGPDDYDNFADERDNYKQTEPATYNNAPLLGILARLAGGHGRYNQLLPATYNNAPNPVLAKRNQLRSPNWLQLMPHLLVQYHNAEDDSSWNAKGKTYYRFHSGDQQVLQDTKRSQLSYQSFMVLYGVSPSLAIIMVP
ncbi:Endoglucanase 6 [Hibiscus syriacus]|uniref:Endoglucanase n=1 Tax=Hibiscus syriacus TaxID=106335 RepID=A0A6A2YWZ6_HIBSY|nr:Endoglucanase 6 [Hibiscus syriacus]